MGSRYCPKGSEPVVRNLALRTTMRRMGIEVPPPEGGQELEVPTPPSVAPSNVSWDPESQQRPNRPNPPEVTSNCGLEREFPQNPNRISHF